MVSQQEAKEYYMNMFYGKAVYVWGMNAPTIIDDKSIRDTMLAYSSPKYTEKYYADKLKEGRGRIGSDCSGMHYGISGYDVTADQYYKRSVKAGLKNGKIKTLPRNKIVLLFKSKNGICEHTGTWIPGVGAIHMKSSKANVVIDSEPTYFDLWAYADFIDYSTPDIEVFDFKAWVKSLQRTLNDYGKTIKIDGSFGSKTLKAITSLGAIKTKSTLKSIVKLLQQFLNAINGAQLKIDGSFGSLTNVAVIVFQKKHGLVADGSVGNKTWEMIQQVCKRGY